jgi:hypothetical protein
MFYFTAFYGNKNSLLYSFYLSAYKVLLANPEQNTIVDSMPLNIMKTQNKLTIWLQDFIAPFYSFTKINYNLNFKTNENAFDSNSLNLYSNVEVMSFNKSKEFSKAHITVNEKGIESFSFSSKNQKLKAACVNE